MSEKKSFFRGKIFKAIIVLIALRIIFGLVCYKPAFQGHVLDAETKKPIEGAVVVVEYNIETMGIPEHYSSIMEVREAMTNANGEFRIPPLLKVVSPLSGDPLVLFTIYKPGYGAYQYMTGAVTPNRYKVDYQKVHPREARFYRGVLTDEEYFSHERGTFKEYWEVKNVPGVPPKQVSMEMGLVELPRLKTKDERSKALVGSPTGYGIKDLPLLFKLVNEERRNLGFQELNY